MKKMMQKLIAILSGFMLSAFSVVPYVPVNADNDNGFVSSEGAETAFDSVRNESNVTTTLQTQITTTSTTGVSTKTVTTTANPRGYDFDGTIFRKDYEWSYYLNDELDLSKLTLAVAVINPSGDYSTEIVESTFSYESGNYSDLYTLDTSKVDMSTPGKYKIYIRSKKDAIGDFETFPSRFLSAGHYKVRMDGHESYFTITVRDIERPVEVEDTDFRFVNHQGSNDCVSITKGMSAAVALYGYKLKEIMENYNAPSVFTFEIGDESIARLNTDCTKGATVLLNGLEIGETTLTATAPNGKTATIIIIVHEYEEPVDYPQTTTTTAHTSMSETETTTTTTTAMIHPEYRTLAEYDKSPMKVGTTRKIIFKHPETGTADDLYYVGEATDNIKVTHEKGTNYVVVTALSEGKASFYAAANGCAFPVRVQLEIVLDEPDEKGDANCDGNVDMSDAVLIMQSIANPSKYKLTDQGKKNADMDGDGITNGDALAIQKKLLKLD